MFFNSKQEYAIFYFLHLSTTFDTISNLCDKEKLARSGTLELQKIRQYLADCLLNIEHYQLPPLPLPPQHPMMELEFITGIKRTFSSYISQIWNEESSLELAEAKANFVFFNFYISTFVSRHLLPTYIEHKNGLFHQSSDITDFYIQGIMLIKYNDREIVERYFAWVNSLFLTQLEKNQELLNESVKHICTFLLSSNDVIAQNDIYDEALLLETKRISRGIYKNLIASMPNILQEKILENDEVVEYLEIEPFSSISINNLSFLSEDFHEAVRNSIQNKNTSLKSIDSDKSVIFFPISEINNQRSIKIKVDEERFLTLSESEFGIYFATKEERFNFLIQKKDLFDCDQKMSLSESGRISAINNHSERYSELKNISDNSIGLAYSKIEEQILNSNSFNWKQFTDMPIQGLKNHFRLDNKTESEFGSTESLETIAKQLIEEEGLYIAFDRMVRFPHKLPEILFEKMTTLSLSEQKQIIESFRQSWRSPLCKLHYFTIVLRLLSDDNESIEKAKKEVEFLFNSEAGELEFELFSLVLYAIYEVVISNKYSKQWSNSMKLALTWAHSSKVFDLILLNQKDAIKHKQLIEYIEDSLYMPSFEIFDVDKDLISDCLHPRCFEKRSFCGFAANALFENVPFDLINEIDLAKYLEPLIFNTTDSFLYPQVTFRRGLSINNVTSSFLFSNDSPILSWFQSEKDIVNIAKDEMQEQLAAFFEELEENYLNIEKWRYLNFFIEDSDLNKVCLEKLNLILEKVDFQQVWETGTQATKIILGFTAKQNHNLSDSLKEKVLSWIKWVVWKISEKYPYNTNDVINDEIDEWVFFISNVVNQWAVEKKNPLASSQRYNDLIFELGQSWNYLPVRLESFFYRMWLNLPVEHNQNIGKNILLARSLK
jgi:hypothetical protein